MAKIHKIQGYIVDIHDEYSKADIEWVIRQYTDLFTKHFKIESADVGKWYDEHPLNYINCKEEECEKYFKDG